MRLCSFSFPIYFLLMFRVGNSYYSFSLLIISLSSPFCWWVNLLLYFKKSFIVFFSYIISICFSFIFFGSLLRFSPSLSLSFFFGLSVLIIAYLSIFIRAIPAYSSDNSHMSVILVAAFTSCLFSFCLSFPWFLVWQVIPNGNLDFCGIMLYYYFLKILNLKDIFFNLAFYDTAPARERGDTPGYCQGETELQFPHLASMDTQEGRVLIMLGNGGNLPPY